MTDKNKKELVAVLGLYGSGKSYITKPYTRQGFTKMSFADPLREIAFKILGYTGKILNYDEFKKSSLNLKKNLFKKEKLNTGRQVLQQTGSVIKDLFGQTVWADLLTKSVLDNKQNVIIDDVRFDYEVQSILKLKRHGYKVTFIWACYEKNDYTNALKDEHESEKLAQFMYLNQDKYNLQDTHDIPHSVIKNILSDLKKQNHN